MTMHKVMIKKHNYTDIKIFQITTSTNQRCSRYFTGTSAATPLVSGVIALTLQAK